MLFNSGTFLLFFPLVTVLYFLLPGKYRWVLLLAASYYFYMCWRMEYIILILLSTATDYISGIQIAKSKSKTNKKLWLASSLTINLGLLILFKYFNFFSDSARDLFALIDVTVVSPELDLLLPVGISFYTFQTLAYTIDVYRGKLEPEYHIGRFALYVAFFPQLVAGPIERASHLLPQFRETFKINYDRILSGLNLIVLGFFKKVVIADRCALYVDEVYNHPGTYGAYATVVATVFFAIQIYCDFSGYSDIAIGTSRIMGYELMDNFRKPYLATGIGDFWRRWHISLSTWFRDYLYIPLGGSKKSPLRNYLNLFVTFLISGLWHGANWTFVLWGSFHGLLLSLEKLFKSIFKFSDKKEPKLVFKVAGIVLTFILVNFGWLLFRSKNISEAWVIMQQLTDFSGGLGSAIIRDGFKGIGVFNFTLTILAIILLIFAGYLPRKMKFRYNFLFLLCGILLIFFLGRNTSNEFIYFQF